MTISFVTDEHVPSVFVTTLRSTGYEVVTANAVFGEATDDSRLLEYCAENDHLLVTRESLKPRIKSHVDEAVVYV